MTVEYTYEGNLYCIPCAEKLFVNRIGEPGAKYVATGPCSCRCHTVVLQGQCATTFR